ncbi:hypothetical protein [Streptomyces gilvosporeus]|uniref:hypothetical protein n=1 Tax=Streptomyces gilvosporeus TaxID=553510 RepID=UPI000D1BBED8|nr:hypothetical protein [Streptomyces gilvosporeus]
MPPSPVPPVPSADRSRPALPPAVQRFLPARSVVGFLALLAVLFVLAYGAGTAAGPVAPGLHPQGGTRTQDPGPAGDMGGMPGMGGAR